MDQPVNIVSYWQNTHVALQDSGQWTMLRWVKKKTIPLRQVKSICSNICTRCAIMTQFDILLTTVTNRHVVHG